MAIRYIVLCITDVDNQRTEAAILYGNLNIKLWDVKRLGNVKGDMEFWGRNKRENNEIYMPSSLACFLPLIFDLNT